MDTKICSKDVKLINQKLNFIRIHLNQINLFYCCKSCDKTANANWRKNKKYSKNSIFKEILTRNFSSTIILKNFERFIFILFTIQAF